MDRLRFKRFLSLAMAILMVFSNIPTAAFASEVVTDCGHGSWNVTTTKEATCTEAGELSFTCAAEGCGNSYTQVTGTADHSYVDGVCQSCGTGDPNAPAVVNDEEQSPVNDGDQTPADNEDQTPVDNEDQTPVDDEDQTPVDDEDQTPVDDEDQTPVDDEDQTPVDDEDQTPDDNEDETPVDDEDQTPVDNEDETPAGPEVDELVEQVQAMLDALPELPSVGTQAQLDAYMAKLEEIYPYLEIMTDEQILQLVGLEEKLYPHMTLEDTAIDTEAELCAALAAGGTVTLGGDITVTETIEIPAGVEVTLDLNGKTVSMVKTGQITANHTMILNKGDLTITDGGENGKLSYRFDGTVPADKQWAYAVTTISNQQGKLTIAGGTIESQSLSTNSNGDSTYVYKFTVDSLTNGNGGDATLKVTGGKITAAKGGPIRGFANSDSCTNTIEITGGEIEGQVWMQDPSANKADKGVLSITGGKITGVSNVDAVCFDGQGDASGFSLNIGGTAVINGTVSLTDDGEPVKAITGGTFTSDVSDFVADGYELKNGTVTEKSYPVMIGDKGYATLQEAVDAVKNGETIVLNADITENVKITQKKGVSVTIDGAEKTFKGVMTVFGNDYGAERTETLTIKNIKFVAAEGAESCIVSPDRTENNAYSYSHNVTVSNCSFTDPDGTVNCAAIRHQDGGDKNWVVEKCEVDSTMHSLLQINNVDDAKGLVVDGCTVNSKNGINLNATVNATIKNTTFNVQGYAVRTGVKTGGNLGTEKKLVLENNTLKSACADGDAVIMLRASSVDTNLTMEQNVVSGTTHISGTTEATKVSAEKNYWDGQSAPVVSGTAIAVESYYADEGLTELVTKPKGTITIGYTSETGVWGEASNANAAVSYVVELYINDKKIATSTLGQKYMTGEQNLITWSIPFAGQNNEDWVTVWEDGYPNKNDVPTAVKLVIDGETVSENVVQMNGPDGLWPVEWDKLEALQPDVAKIGTTLYKSLDEAIEEAKDGDTIEIIAKELTFEENAASIVIDKAVTIEGAGKDATKLTFNSATSAFVIQSGNVTIRDMTIVQGAKDNSFHISVSKGAWDAPAIQYSNIKIENIAFQGGDNALVLIGENVTVNNCSFTEQDSHNILVYSLKGDSKITNNTFNASKGNNKSAILYEGGADNATDLSGFIGGGNLTISGNTANGKGVFFQFTNWGKVEGMNLAITGNKIDAFTNKAIALYDMDGAVKADGDEFGSVTVTENVFTNVPADRPILKEYTGTVAVDASGNYLGSESPDVAELLVGEQVTALSYYKDEALTQLVDLSVAKIGDKAYASLQAAVDAARNGETITLMADITENVTISKPLTIDGGNFKYVGKMTIAGNAEAKETVTFKNVKFMADTAVGNNVIVNMERYAEATFVGCDFTSNSTDTYYNSYKGIYISNDCTIVLQECTASKLYYMAHIAQGSTSMTVEDCTLTDMVYGIGAFKCTNVSVKNFTYNGMASGINVKNSGECTLTMENVKITTTMSGQYPVAMWKPDSGNASKLYTVYLKGQNYANNKEMTWENEKDWFVRQDESNLYKIVDIANAVAKIGDEYYYDFQTAIDEAASNATVELLKSVTLEETLVLSKSLTLDLGENALTGEIQLDGAVTLTAPENLTVTTIQNYKVKYKDGAYVAYQYQQGGTWGGIDWTLSNEGVLTIAPTKGTPVADPNSGKTFEVGAWRETVVYNSNGDGTAIGGQPYDMNNVTKLVIKEGVTSIGSFTAKFPNLTGEVVIPSTVTYIGQEAFQNSPITKLTFATGGTNELCIAPGAFKNLQITEVTLPSDRPVHMHAWVFMNNTKLEHVTIPANVTIVPGSSHVEYWKNGTAHTGSNYDISIFADVPNLQSVTFGSETVRDSLLNGYNLRTNIEAYIGLTAYSTVAAAIDAAENDETVKLVKDVTLTDTLTIPADKTIILDLNGKTISQSKECTAHYEMIKNEGNLTITGNGKLSFTDTGAGDPNFGWGSYTITNRGTLVVENGTIENLSKQNEDSVKHMYCAIQQSAGSVTIKDGTITTSYYRSVRVNGGELTINGGTFNGQVWIQPNQGNATLTVTGGTFAPAGGDGSSIFLTNEGEGKQITAAITGGTFTTKIGATNADALGGVITGGNFTESAKTNTNAALLSKDAKFSGEANADGYYTVVGKVYVVQIGTTKYESLTEAAAAAQDGDTIVLLKDITENAVVEQRENVKITIDGDGKTMTGSITVNGMSEAYATTGLTIQNVKFNTTSIDADAAINLGDGNTSSRYTSNVTVKDCTFTGAGQAKAAVKSYTGGDKNLTITSCTVDNTMHSLVQVTNVDGLVIEGCTVNSKNGINLNSSSNVEIRNSTIEVSGYAVRAGVNGGTSGKITLTENTLKTTSNEDAVIIIRGTASQQIDLTMTKNVVSGAKHISGNTAETEISADANYWEGKDAPVADTEIEVDTYYADPELKQLKKGSLEGAGTEQDPYLIQNAEELFLFAKKVNAGKYQGAYVKLMADIDLATAARSTSNWTPIGTADVPFKGHFDGNGKTISNLVVSGEKNVGFFGYATNSTIKNLNIANATVTGTDCVGAIAGQVYASSTIDNCHVSGSIKIEGQTNVGGIVGKYYVKVSNSSVIGDGVDTSCVKGVYAAADFEGDNIGGIMGHGGETNNFVGNTVQNITISGTRKVGGIVGTTNRSTNIQDCVVENVVITTTATAEYAADNATSMDLGGLNGHYYDSGSDGTISGNGISGVNFVIPAGVSADAGAIIGGDRGTTTGEPKTNINAIGNTVANVTGATQSYLLVADVNGVQYSDLANAIAAADGKTVTVLSDIVLTEGVTVPAGTTVTLDLNGKTISYTSTTGTADQLILNYGKLTINDTDGNGKITFQATNSAGTAIPGYASNTITNCGELVVNNGTVENTTTGTAAYVVDNNSTSANVSLTVNGGKLEQTQSGYSGAVRLLANSETNTNTVTVNGGTVVGRRAIWIHLPGSYQNAKLATLNINGGTIDSTDDSRNLAVYVFSYGDSFAGTEINISDGMIDGNIEFKDSIATSENTYPIPENDALKAFAINGGRLTGVINNATASNNGAGLNIGKPVSGGNFKYGDVEAYLVEGCSLTYTGGWFHVVTVPVANVAGTDYTTLQAAIAAAAKTGDTVYLKKSFTEKETVKVPEGAAIVLDLKGYTFSGSILAPNADLTIRNGSIVNKNAGVSGLEINAGKLTLTDVNISSARHAVRIDGAVEAIIDGGEYRLIASSGKTQYALNVSGAANVTIKDGTFVGPKGTTSDSGSAVRVQSGATVTVEGGSFSGGKTKTLAVDGTLVLTGGTYDQDPSDYVADGFKAVKNADGTYGIGKTLKGSGTAEDPFQISNVEELILFRDSVNAGETDLNAANVYVALTADIDLAGIDWSVNIGDDCSVTFDGIFDGQNHVIKNLIGTETAAKADGYVCTGLFGAIYGSAVVKNLTIDGASIDTGAFTGNNAGVVVGFAYNATGSIENVKVINSTINAANITGTGTIVGYDYYGKLTVKDCSVENTTINGKAYVGGVIGYASSNSNISDNTVDTVTVSGTGAVGGVAGIMLGTGKADSNTVKNVDLTVTGEYWQNSAAIVAGSMTGTTITVSNTTCEDVTVNGAASTAIVGSELVEKPTEALKKVQARIGDVYYTTFEAAYAAAVDGDTVTLLVPIAVAAGETLTLDKAVTIEYTSNVPGEDMITNRGTLVVNGATLVYNNTDTTASNVTVSTISCEPGSVLNVKSGTVENDSANNAAKGIYAYAIDLLTNGNLGDVTATISGGEVISTNYMAIRQFNNGTACKNTLTVTDGKIYGAKRAIQVHMDNNAAYTDISGGTIEGGDYSLCFLTGSGNLSVTGGTFLGSVYSGTEGFISGGTFDEAVYEGYCAEGCIAVKNSNGTYDVMQGSFVAAIGEVKYASIKAAIDAAKAGDTITLIADITEDVTVNKSVTIDGAGKTYTGKMTLKADTTIKNVNFDGKGYNGYAVETRGANYVTIEDCTAKNYGYGFLQLASGTALTTVKNVTISDMNYGVKTDYSNVVVLENVKIDAAVAAVLNSNYGEKTITVKNSDLNILGTWTRNNTNKTTYVFEGENSIDEFVIDAAIDNFKLAEGATLTAPEEVTVTAKDEGYEVEYVNGKYVAVPMVRVAQIGETQYKTLAEAIAAAEAGQTIELIADVTENVTIDKNLTIDGTNGEGKFQYTGKITINGNVAVAVKNAKFEKGYIYHNGNSSGQTGTLTVTDCSFANGGYAVETTYVAKVTIENCTVTNQSLHYGRLSTKDLVVKDVTISGGNYVAHIVTGSTAYFENVKASDMYCGLLVQNVGPKTITIKNCEFNNAQLVEWDTKGTATDTYIFEGNNTVTSLINSQYAKLVLADMNSTLTAPEGAAVTTNAEGYEVEYVDGKYVAVPIVRVAQIGETQYKTLAEAITAAKAGDTITFLADIEENVTISKDITIDGAEKNYTGTMTANAGLTVTVQNVNFVNGGIDKPKGQKTTTGTYTVKNCTFDGEGEYAYAFRFYGANTVTIENCTVKDYLYSFLYIPSSTITVSVKDVTVENCPSYAVYFASGVTNATFENLTVKNSNNGFVINNTANRTFTIKNVKMENVTSAISEANGTNPITCTVYGENDFGTAASSEYAKYILAETSATLTAPEGATVTSGVENYNVFYNGTSYYLAQPVAKIGDVSYDSVQAAIDAAETDETVTLISDIDIAEAEIGKLDGSYDTYFKVEGKSVTIDLNGKKISGRYAGEGMLVGLFSTDNNGHLTLIGNGTVDITATGKVYALIANYESDCSITINNGTYTLDEASDSMIYSGCNEGVIIKDGTFTLGNVGNGENGKPWMFNVLGQNEGHVVVNGGTFNVDVNHQFWAHEVKVPETKALKNNGNDTWTVVDAVAYVVETNHKYNRNVGYATLAEAIAATGKDVTIIADCQLTQVWNNSNTITVNEGVSFTMAEDAYIVLTDAAATVKAAEGLNVTTDIADSKVVYAKGVYKVVAKNYTVQIKDGEKFETLAEAITAATAGDTIVFLTDITEDVTVSKNLTIDGAEFKYTGNIAVTGSTVDVTVKNVNFVNGSGYAITTDRINSITVENCTVKNYGYGFLYANKSTPTVTVKDVTVTGGNYGFHYVYGSSATLENVTMTNVKNGLYIQNYAGKTITLKNCDIGTIAIWERDGYSGVQTFKFEGKNTVDTLSTSQYAAYVLSTEDAVLVTDEIENLNITSGLTDYNVVYETAAYKLVAKDYVAQIGEAKFESLAEAVEAAKDGETVTVIADHEIACDEDPLITVAGKSITINLNGKTITANVADTDRTIRIVFKTEVDAELTMTDSVGTGTVVANGEGVLYYMFRNAGKTTIKGGNYELSAFDGGAMFFSENSNMTVEGGKFTQTTTGWMFNTAGNGANKITVTGGLFNRDFINGENENTWNEVVLIPDTKILVKSEIAGYWTLGDAVAKNTDTGIGYGTVDEALAAAVSGEKVILLVDTKSEESVVMVPAGVTLDLNGKYLTAANMIAFGSVIDNGETAGGLVISNDTTEAMVSMQENNPYLPIYDTNTGSYKFFKYDVENLGVKSVTENGEVNTDKIKLGVRIRFYKAEAYKVLAETSDSEFKLVEEINWGGDTPIRYTFTESTITGFAAEAYNRMAVGTDVTIGITVTLKGLKALGNAEIEYAANIASQTLVEQTSETKTYTVG